MSESCTIAEHILKLQAEIQRIANECPLVDEKGKRFAVLRVELSDYASQPNVRIKDGTLHGPNWELIQKGLANKLALTFLENFRGKENSPLPEEVLNGITPPINVAELKYLSNLALRKLHIRWTILESKNPNTFTLSTDAQ